MVNEPERRKQFRQFVNTPDSQRNIEQITERKQTRAADWPKDFQPVKMDDDLIKTDRPSWEWQKVAHIDDLMPTESAASSCSVKIGDSQIAIFSVPKRGLYATQQMCPHRRAFVLDHGIVGETKDKEVVSRSSRSSHPLSHLLTRYRYHSISHVRFTSVITL